MVRRANIITKQGDMILASFFEEEQLRFSNPTLERSLLITPHQSTSLVETRKVADKKNSRCKEVNVKCVCIEKNLRQESSFDDTMSTMIRERNSLLWLDPTRIPTECLACVLAKWLRNTKPTDQISLGIMIPLSIKTPHDNGNFKAWVPTPHGPLKKDFEDTELLIWYPSLDRAPKFLQEITNRIKPFDIFPIVEFPQIIDYGKEKKTTLHHQLLDQYRTRTRNFIYLNNKSPEEALKTLFGSFQAISHNGKMPRSLIITPGGEPVTYLVTLLAGIFAGGTFITLEAETPFAEPQGMWGFAVFKKCE
jgi:hypothetical protein